MKKIIVDKFKTLAEGFSHKMQKWTSPSIASATEGSLKSQATALLNLKDWSLFFNMVNTGYKPTKQQKKLLSDTFLQALEKENDLVITFLSSGYKINKEQFMAALNQADVSQAMIGDLMLNTSEIHAKYPSNNRLHHLLPEIKKNLPQYREEIFQTWLHNIQEEGLRPVKQRYVYGFSNNSLKFNNHIAWEVGTIVEKYYAFKDYFLDKLNMAQVNLIVNNLQEAKKREEEARQYVIDEIRQQRCYTPHGLELQEQKVEATNEYYKNTMNTIDELSTMILNDFKKHHNYDQKLLGLVSSYPEKIAKLVQQTHEEKMFQLNMDELPRSAKEIVKRISEDAKLLEGKDLDFQNKMLLTQILEKNIAQTITKYLEVPPDYRDNFRNKQEKSAKDIMIESLETLHGHIKEMLENKAENGLRELDVNHRYIKSLK